ncbi:unnamed protein product [Danaus chrysippus]|uniref:(African queen) hypothetical protein n=1 Tax=Danaus chrysippus TaxID=151541 RepID=A0A8J2W0F3_9NEOP|nr:unnamed protein product [Danaus chrysippus]
MVSGAVLMEGWFGILVSVSVQSGGGHVANSSRVDGFTLRCAVANENCALRALLARVVINAPHHDTQSLRSPTSIGNEYIYSSSLDGRVATLMNLIVIYTTSSNSSRGAGHEHLHETEGGATTVCTRRDEQRSLQSRLRRSEVKYVRHRNN